MKKLVTVLMILALCIPAIAGGKAGGGVPKEKILGLVQEYNHKEGFHVIRLGGIGTSLARAVAKIAIKAEGGPEAAEAVKLLNDIKRVAVVEYEECNESVKNSFNSKLEGILTQSELLMEVKDSEDVVHIYGVVNEDASKVKDFVIHVPNDCALICMFGSIPMDAVAKIMEMQ